jgi:hypothetical protein
MVPAMTCIQRCTTIADAVAEMAEMAEMDAMDAMAETAKTDVSNM